MSSPASSAPLEQPPLLTLSQARDSGDAAMATLLGWVESYLMNGHAELGRVGAVCPFTRQAARLDSVRLGIATATPEREDEVFALARASFERLDSIPVKPGMAHFRTVIIGFPHCADAAGVAMLQRVQARHKYYSLSRNRMVGLMHANSQAPGLWNGAFRPLRAPLPVLAVRHMVEHDAPFAARHPLLLLPYLARFRLGGVKRLYAHLRAAG
ncbi:MAG: DUF6875 domain-containing protein [Bosea sp. (in: a-proteobacteria)]